MDEWGRDPSVQAMRKVFKGMEKALEEILSQLAIAPGEGGHELIAARRFS